MTMSSKHALRPDDRSEPELEPPISSVSNSGSMSEYRNVIRSFKARPDASLTVIFESLPSGVPGSESTPLGELDEVGLVEVRGRFAAGWASGAIRCSSLGQRAWIMARLAMTETKSIMTAAPTPAPKGLSRERPLRTGAPLTFVTAGTKTAAWGATVAKSRKSSRGRGRYRR